MVKLRAVVWVISPWVISGLNSTNTPDPFQTSESRLGAGKWGRKVWFLPSRGSQTRSGSLTN